MREIKEPDSVSIPLSTVEQFEQDAHVLTMVGSFLDRSGATSTRLLDEGASEGTDSLSGCS